MTKGSMRKFFEITGYLGYGGGYVTVGICQNLELHSARNNMLYVNLKINKNLNVTLSMKAGTLL